MKPSAHTEQRAAAGGHQLWQALLALPWLALASGCAHDPCPPLRAAWYLHDTATVGPAIFVALLNEGAKQHYTGFTINPLLAAPTAWSAAAPVADQAAATRPPFGFGAATLQTGEFKLLRIDMAGSSCSLPVAVVLHCSGGASRVQPVPGALPNYMRDDWIVGQATCVLPKKPPP